MNGENTLATVESITEPFEAHAEIHFEPAVKTGLQGSGYYRLITDELCGYKFEQGTLAYVHVSDYRIRVFIDDHEFVYRDKKGDDDKTIDRVEDFENDFAFEPNGSKLRQQQIINLMEEIDQTNVDMSLASKALNGFHPYASPTGQLEGSTSLVTTGGMQHTKLALATLRNNVGKMKKALTAKTAQLKSWLNEQSNALEAKAKDLAIMVGKAENAIWTINLYLGKEEEIVTLRKGTPAPPTQKITIRQNLLFMDEECGLEARDEGIDVQTIKLFDQWLLEDPAHLTQILPETKGIVALHIRSTKKHYDDPWMDVEINKANLNYTYFLIRNGDNVYRVYIDMVIGRHLFPSISEFEEYFWDYEYNSKQERIKVPLIPGSEKYIKSMDEAAAHRKYYLRIVLVLQGLMDRTPIFKPMVTNLINLCDPSHCEEWLHLIYESEKVITDGRPTFDTWQRDINTKLEVGHRIIGVFDYFSHIKRTRRDDYGDHRIYPENACYPTSNVLHTIDERDGDHFIFRYTREDDRVYPRYGSSHPPKTRARCWVEKSDKFMIDFDAVTLEELKYYQGHKLSRASYKNMVPLLEAAIALKEQETSDEAPFRLLLIGQLMATYSVSNTDAESQVDELISWWKFKNRTHRALLSDDKKALDMIITEYGLRDKQKKVRERAENAKDLLLKVICGQTPEPIYVAHKSNNQYVAYIPQNNHNVWVREQVWTYNQQTNNLRLKEEKQWRTVDKRHIRWETLYKTEAWDKWAINPQMSKVITDAEIKAVLNEKIAALTKTTPDKRRRFWDGEESDIPMRFMPLGAYYNSEFEIYLWYSEYGPSIPTELLIHSPNHAHATNWIKIGWKRTVNGVKAGFGQEYHSHDFNTEPGKRPWDAEDAHVIQVWEDNIKRYADEERAYKIFEEERRKLIDKYDHVESEVRQLYHAQEVTKAKAEFDADFGDPELWEDHLRGLKIPVRNFHCLEKAIEVLTEHGIEVEGWSLQQVYDEADKLGVKEHLNSPEFYQSERDRAPIDYRITKHPLQENNDE